VAPVEYLAQLRTAGFSGVQRLGGFTNFVTSSTTRGARFVATKPLAPAEQVVAAAPSEKAPM